MLKRCDKMLIEPVAFVAALITWAIPPVRPGQVQVVLQLQLQMPMSMSMLIPMQILEEFPRSTLDFQLGIRNTVYGIRNTMRSRRATFQTERHVGSESPAEPRNESTAEWPKKADGWRWRRRRRSPVAEAAVAEAPRASMWWGRRESHSVGVLAPLKKHS